MANNISTDFSRTDLNVDIFDTFNEEQSEFMTRNVSTISTDCFLNSSIPSEESMDLNQTQQSDYESDHDTDENIKPTIQNGATFCNWKSLEDTLKEYELKIGFKSIKYRVERDNSGEIIRQYFLCENSGDHQPKKKADTTCQREKESKKVGCEWQLNAGYRKNLGAIVINKFVENHNHPLAPHRKEFAPRLRSLSQEVFDAIKFLTQECNLGAKAQRRYISKKFPDQPLYDRDLYNAIRRYTKQMGNQRENDAADMVKWLMEQQEREPGWAIYIEFEGAKIYVFTTFCAGMQSTQRVESLNGIIKGEVGAKMTLLNLGKSIQTKLEREAQHQRLSEYKNALPTRGLPTISSVFFKTIQNDIKKFLTLESALVQNIQVSQSILYRAHSVEIPNNLMLSKAYEYSEGYLENEYDTLQASLETIVNMVNQPSTIMEMNHVTSIRGPDILEPIDEFVGLITRFIENHTGVNANQRMLVDITQIDNPKKLTHKGRPKRSSSTQDDNIFQDLAIGNEENSRSAKRVNVEANKG
ncbi:5408_t:CDS:2, partial [Racocetra persica]